MEAAQEVEITVGTLALRHQGWTGQCKAVFCLVEVEFILLLIINKWQEETVELEVEEVQLEQQLTIHLFAVVALAVMV